MICLVQAEVSKCFVCGQSGLGARPRHHSGHGSRLSLCLLRPEPAFMHPVHSLLWCKVQRLAHTLTLHGVRAISTVAKDHHDLGLTTHQRSIRKKSPCLMWQTTQKLEAQAEFAGTTEITHKTQDLFKSRYHRENLSPTTTYS